MNLRHTTLLVALLSAVTALGQTPAGSENGHTNGTILEIPPVPEIYYIPKPAIPPVDDLSNAPAPIPVKNEIRPIAGGATADYGLSTVVWPTELTVEQGISLTDRDGQTLVFRPAFLVLADRVTGHNFLLAELTNAAGKIFSATEVSYPNAFESEAVTADLRYEYDSDRGSLEQYVTLRKNFAIPEGLDTKNLRLECWTEWLQGEPQEIKRSVLTTREAVESGPAVEEENLEISFGVSKIVARGKAFSVGAEDAAIPVVKSWTQIPVPSGEMEKGQPVVRKFLIEAVDYLAAKPQLDKLGKAKGQAALRTSQTGSLWALALPSSRARMSDRTIPMGRGQTVALAANGGADKGFVLDFCAQYCIAAPYGLISWWDAENTQNRYADVQGVNNGTHYSMTNQTGQIGSAHYFNGVGGYIGVSDSTSLNFGDSGSFSIEGWIYAEATNTAYGVQTIVDKRYTPNDYTATGYALYLINGLLGFQLANTANSIQSYHTASPNLCGAWHHIAVTVNRTAGDGIKFYVDGVNITNMNPTSLTGSINNTQPFLIGKHAQPGANAGFKGKIDELSIYNRVLIQADITAIKNANQSGKCGRCVPCGNCAQPLMSSLVGWWPGDGSGTDLVSGGTMSLVGSATYANSVVDRGFSLDGGGYAYAAASSALNVGPGAGFTIEAWVTMMDITMQPLFEWYNDPTGAHLWANYTTDGQTPGALFANLVDTSGVSHNLQATYVLAVGNPTHIAITYDRNNGIGSLYANGNLVTNLIMGTFTPKTAFPFYLGCRPPSYRFNGKIDEPAVYNRALTASEIQTIYNAGSNGKCKTSVGTIAEAIDQPTWSITSGTPSWFYQKAVVSPGSDDAAQSGSISHNQTTYFETSITGPKDLSFRWRTSSESGYDWLSYSIDGVLQGRISGEHDWETVTHGIPSGAHTVRWAYTKDSSVNSGSDAGWVDIAQTYTGTAPVITANPSSATVLQGRSVTFTVAASGSSPMVYRWYKAGTFVVEGPQLWYVNIQTNVAGNYYATASNYLGIATSSTAVLTVLADYDGDAMPDAWETANGLITSTNDASEDFDGDGVTNLAEYQAQTNPRDPWLVSWGDAAASEITLPAGLRGVKSLDGGISHGMALLSNATVIAWGYNAHGETNVPAGLIDVTEIAASGFHSAARLQNGTVVNWGKSLGTKPDGLTDIRSISLGIEHALVLKSNGTTVVWGTTNFSGATNWSDLSNVKAIAAGHEHNLALLSNGTLVAWSAETNEWAARRCTIPPSATNVVAIVAGAYHSLALRADGTVVAWGAGDGTGQLYEYGQSQVPSGLSGVSRIAAGGHTSLALMSNGVVIAWGEKGQPGGLNGVEVIGAGDDPCLAWRTGRQTPVILEQPAHQCAQNGESVLFSINAAAPNNAFLKYQWQFYNTNLPYATNATYLVSNASPASVGEYRVQVSNLAGSLWSSAAHLGMAGPVQFEQVSPGAYSNLVHYGQAFSFNLLVTNASSCIDPVKYDWTLNGETLNQPGIVFASGSVQFSVPYARNRDEGLYTLMASNSRSTNSISWYLKVAGEGTPFWWGSIGTQSWDYLLTVTNTLAVACGSNHRLILRDDGTVVARGSNDWRQCEVPDGLPRAMGVAAGDGHSLVLLTDGTVRAWGRHSLGQTNVPNGLSSVQAIAAAGQQSLALLSNGTLVAWGDKRWDQTNTTGINGVKQIACGTNFNLALRTNGQVLAWGSTNYGVTTVPPTLSNVIAIAAGGSHALALQSNGIVIGWGANLNGQAQPPVGTANIMGIAAGYAHSVAIKNNGKLMAWGDNSAGQTNVPGFCEVKLLSAGGNQSMASSMNPLVQYPVEIPRDLLLIYNTNSPESSNTCFYYLRNRPFVSTANVLGIGCTTNCSSFTPAEYTNVFVAQITNWFAANPTKRPLYVILFMDIPWRINTNPAALWGYDQDPYFAVTPRSLQSQLRNLSVEGWRPFVTALNMRHYTSKWGSPPAEEACIAYIDKLKYFGETLSPGELFISARNRAYDVTNHYLNINYVVDNVRKDHYPDRTLPPTTNALLAVGVPATAILYADAEETPGTPGPHILSASNVCGYVCWGAHSTLGNEYSRPGTTHPEVKWTGDSRWWVIQTIESHNGMPYNGHGDYFMWFSDDAFGGANYSNTPVGALTHTDEPGWWNPPSQFFPLWESGRIFVFCAWNSVPPGRFQAVGDPFVRR